MNHKLLKLQVAICVFLSMILAGEWGYDQIAARDLQALLQPKPPSEFESDDLPEWESPDITMDAVIERPLFIEGRKPIVEVAQATAPNSVDTGQLDEWSLIGIYTHDKHTIAWFKKNNETKKYQKLNEQQMLAGWQLQRIQADRVVFNQAGQEKTVMLRKPRPQIKPTAVPGTPRNKPPVPVAPVTPVQPVAVPPTSPENDTDESE